MNAEGVVLDLTRMNRILDWNPDTGVISVEPGVTIQQLWQYTIEDGWWPAVVPGTMYPTMGGCAGMDIHGKNNFKVGPFGDHILDFDIATPSGELLTCSRTKNPELFHAAIGGAGLLGVFTRLTLQLKKVYSGHLDVTAYAHSNFDELFEIFEECLPNSDYLVAWVDCFAKGDSLGRGNIHQAHYLKPGEDPSPTQSLRVVNQELPDSMFGIVPKSVIWRFMKPFWNDVGVKAINTGRYVGSSKIGHGARHRQSHAGFAFLLDYVPNWKYSYKPHGLIQCTSSFISGGSSHQDVFSKQLQLSHNIRRCALSRRLQAPSTRRLSDEPRCRRLLVRPRLCCRDPAKRGALLEFDGGDGQAGCRGGRSILIWPKTAPCGVSRSRPPWAKSGCRSSGRSRPSTTPTISSRQTSTVDFSRTTSCSRPPLLSPNLSVLTPTRSSIRPE